MQEFCSKTATMKHSYFFKQNCMNRANRILSCCLKTYVVFKKMALYSIFQIFTTSLNDGLNNLCFALIAFLIMVKVLKCNVNFVMQISLDLKSLQEILLFRQEILKNFSFFLESQSVLMKFEFWPQEAQLLKKPLHLIL